MTWQHKANLQTFGHHFHFRYVLHRKRYEDSEWNLHGLKQAKRDEGQFTGNDPVCQQLQGGERHHHCHAHGHEKWYKKDPL